MRRFLPIAALLALAATAQQSGSGPKHFNVPKRYGKFVAVYADQLLFEDPEGTLRSVYPNGSLVVFQIDRR